MAITPEDVAQLDERAHQVGLAIGWTMSVRATIERDFTVVAEDGEGRVVGTATLGALGGDHVVWKIYAVPAAQGVGVDTALMRALLGAADRRRDVLIELVQGNGAPSASTRAGASGRTARLARATVRRRSGLGVAVLQPRRAPLTRRLAD